MSLPDPAARPPRSPSGVLRSHPWTLVLIAVVCLAAVGAVVAILRQPTSSTRKPAPRPPVPAAPPKVEAQSGILIDATSGTVLWSKHPDRRLPPASCTKIMTALLVLEREHDIQNLATVPAIPLPQTVGIGLLPGQRISVWQALRALLIKSANDAALTLASYVAGDEPSFVALMNQRAQQLGLSHTHFENSRGTPQPGHVSSARDLATLGRFAMRDPRFREIVHTRTAVITWPPDHSVEVASHNRLLHYPWGNGIKTGATSQSGMVLVGSGQPGLVPLIVVTMHEPTRDQEERDAVSLFTWGSAQYARRTLVRPGDVVVTVPLKGGGRVALTVGAPLTAVVRAGATVSSRRAVPARLTQKPPGGAVVGRAGYWSDGVRVAVTTLVAAGAASAAPSPGSSAAP
jgi:D-alanyl-D-alanine carboxypeptidase (penicillin-binding protein 5/6)